MALATPAWAGAGAAMDAPMDAATGVAWAVALTALAAAVALGVAMVRARGAAVREQVRREALVAQLQAVTRGENASPDLAPCCEETAALIGDISRLAESLAGARREARDKGDRLETAMEGLRQADKAKDDFLVLISHEVRTPLTALMGGVDVMRLKLERAEPEQRRALAALDLPEVADIIASSGRRLSGFLNDAIQMTAVQNHERELALNAVPVGKLLEIGLGNVRERARARGIEVVNEITSDEDWAVLCDLGVLRLALERIFSNAVVHNRDGGRIVIRRAAAIPGLQPEQWQPDSEMMHRLWSQESFRDWAQAPIHWQLLEIFNTGDPIPEDRRRALFGKFELVGRIEHHQRGSGLSLPIAQAAIEHHGGRIHLDSSSRDGNSFFLLLPCVPVDAGARGTTGRLWDQPGQGRGRVAREEEIGQVGDAAGLQVEFEYAGAGPARAGH
jgi:signal transduction histidine kinase